MKLYLMAGGLLITAASVYGITDYINTKNKKEFKNLYNETPVTLKEDIKLHDVKEEDFSRAKLETVVPPNEEPKPAVATKQKKSKVKSKKPAASVEEKPEIEVIPMPEEIKAPANITEMTIASAPKERGKLKKKVNMKMFSRGAIREEVVIRTDSAAVKKNQ
jgi:hypothetical protein